MDIQTIISHFGYIGVLVGTFFEGETILVIAGFAAHRGYMSLPLVIIFAFTGSIIGDQLYFFIGRKKGLAFLEKRPKLQPKVRKFQALLNKYNTLIVFSFRFIYGLRTVSPFVIGLSKISAIKFLIINIISGIVWAVLIGSLGYLFGQTIEIFIDDVKRYEVYFISAGFLIIIIRLLFLRLNKKK